VRRIKKARDINQQLHTQNKGFYGGQQRLAIIYPL
jgi:hypothetical protein